MFKSTLLGHDQQLANAERNSPSLRFGASGSGVKRLQLALIALGAKMPVSTRMGVEYPDGIFGKETQQAVIQFQRQNGLVQDGVAGRLTLGRLDSMLFGSKKDPAANAIADLFEAALGFVSEANPGATAELHKDMKSAISRLSGVVGNDPTSAPALRRLLGSGR